MERREFVRVLSAGCATILAGCDSHSRSSPENDRSSILQGLWATNATEETDLTVSIRLRDGNEIIREATREIPATMGPYESAGYLDDPIEIPERVGIDVKSDASEPWDEGSITDDFECTELGVTFHSSTEFTIFAPTESIC